MKKEYEYAIVGGGPAGIVFYQELVKSHKTNIILFEKGNELCSELSTYGLFVRNHEADEKTKWDFLVDGKHLGSGIADYFQKGFNGVVQYSEIKQITKTENIYQLATESGEVYKAENVVLATGARLKQIDAIRRLPAQEFNISSFSAEDLKKIDFSNHEIILIGSGDKTLLKAARVAKHIEEKYTQIPRGPITIFVKNKFADHANPDFVRDVESYVKKGTIQIIDNCWQIEEIKLNENNLVEKIISTDSQYQIKAPHGAYVGVFIGFEGRWPKLVNCSVEDFICIGDLDLALNKKKINIPGALLSAEQRAKEI
ncbi:MAG TPA: NAD(P)-binding domain-containing protein [Patescibacteria group bacterium]